ncbi:MAG: protein kinase [Blastocatellales bacterium]
MKSPNRLQQIESLFHAALEREPAERAAFLAEACGNDASLRDAVNTLLAAHDQSFSLLDQRHAGDEFDSTSAPTKHLPDVPAQPPAANPVSHSSGDGQREGRFVAGAMLAGRYRIVGLLGKGGMGEVYKAEDLKLNQTVALKFLPESIALDGGMLARFHNEVRIARQVAHPNVCRVYDIGEVEGLHFLSMEFIDGEDLSSLLRRIGRLPGDKAVEIARQLCAGLAAAHEAGVLHRDLKPANVMIDGRGKARITDFGLAVVSEELRGDEVMAGTPAYMAPEQLTGKEVTQRSDIYALGLVLYELFTGKRVFEAKSIQELISLHEKSTPPTPSSHVKDIDPLAERVILRCLEKDPKARPASAVQVALALPGGDPLQAVLAMGETPSPEMVAASGQKTGLRPAVAVACLLAFIIGLTAAVYFRSKVRLIDMTPFEHPPEVLSQKAREIVAQLGYPKRPADTAYGFEYDRPYLDYVLQQAPAVSWRQRFAQSRPSPIYFWQRESQQRLLPIASAVISEGDGLPDVARVKEGDPPQAPGMLSLRLDMQGRLIRFSAEPTQFEEGPPPSPQPDKDLWARLFSAAEVNAAQLTPTEPKWAPPSACDTRAAWSVNFPEQPDLADLSLRVETAAWRGRPVYFEIIGPWTTPASAIQWAIGDWMGNLWSLAVVSFGGLLAWRNLRRGRSDRKGAFRLTVFVVVGYFVAALIGSSVIGNNLALCLYLICMTWPAYMGLEPYVRRRWPVMLISWNRVLAGSWRDPLVGRDVLIGLIIGAIVTSIPALPGSGSIPHSTLLGTSTLLRILSGDRLTTSALISLPAYSVTGALMCVFLLFLMRLLARRDSLAAVLFTLFMTVFYALGQWQTAVALLLIFGLYAVVIMRYGLMTLVSTFLVVYVLNNFPVTLNFAAWYAGTGLAPIVLLLALAVFAFYTSLGGQKVFTGKLLEE